MKKIFFILLLSPLLSCGQPSFNILASSFNTAGITSVSGNTYVSGRLYIFFVGISNDAATPGTVSLSGTSQTWDELNAAGGISNGGNRKRLQAFRFAPGSNNSNQTDFTVTGSQDGMFYFLIEVTSVDVTGTNGSNGVVRTATGSANSANPSLDFGTSLLSRSSVLAAFINGVNPFTGTEESGWTESIDGGYGTPNTGGYLMYWTNTTDSTPTVTAASGNWAGFAIELKASGRRVIISN